MSGYGRRVKGTSVLEVTVCRYSSCNICDRRIYILNTNLTIQNSNSKNRSWESASSLLFDKYRLNNTLVAEIDNEPNSKVNNIKKVKVN